MHPVTERKKNINWTVGFFLSISAAIVIGKQYRNNCCIVSD